MHWEATFARIRDELEADAAAQQSADVRELTYAERAGVGLTARLAACLGTSISATLVGGEVVAGSLVEVCPQWFVVESRASQVLVPAAAVVALSGVGRWVAPPGAEPAPRLGLAAALRAISADGRPVRVVTAARDTVGWIRSVGADHLDLVASMPGENDHIPIVTIPFLALHCIESL